MKLFDRLFRQRSDDLSHDPRWKRFNDEGYVCSCCEQSFSGIFDIGFDHPDPWVHGNREQMNLEVLEVGEDRLASDLCKSGDDYFVRSVLYIPIRGSEKQFGFGCWGSLSEANFQAYLDDAKGEKAFEGAFSWLSNNLPCFESKDAIPCNMKPGSDGQRPQLWVQEEFPLAQAQRDGISFDGLLDIYAKCGNDLRPHLSDAL